MRNDNADTPRSNAAELQLNYGYGPSGYVPLEFARELERELNSAERDSKRYRWLRESDQVPLLRGACDLLTGNALDDAVDDAINAA